MIELPTVVHPTDRPNFYIMTTPDGWRFAFSYKTVVGFAAPGFSWTVHENAWGPTTGKHLNYLDGGGREHKKLRLPADKFHATLEGAYETSKLVRT